MANGTTKNGNGNGKKNGNGTVKKSGRPPLIDATKPLYVILKKGDKEERQYQTDQLQRLITALKLGISVETACRYARIHKDTYYDWYNKGRDERNLALKEDREPVTDLKVYAEFSDEIDSAKAEVEVRAAMNLTKMSDKSLNASVFLLQTANRDHWKQADTPQGGSEQPQQPANITIKVVGTGSGKSPAKK